MFFLSVSLFVYTVVADITYPAGTKLECPTVCSALGSPANPQTCKKSEILLNNKSVPFITELLVH